jgi:RyR domain
VYWLHAERIEVPEIVFARVFYAASQVLQEALGDPQPPWDELPAWQQDAMVDVTRRCMLGSTPEQMHTSWVQHFSAQGWAYGPEKNWETKQHPVIIPWHKLPLRYQARFKLWQAMVMTLMLEMPEYSKIHFSIRS